MERRVGVLENEVRKAAAVTDAENDSLPERRKFASGIGQRRRFFHSGCFCESRSFCESR